MTYDFPMIRTLIVDDEPLARRTLRRLLDYNVQVEVVGEMSGTDAPAAIRDLQPDLMFLDIQMPQMNGFEVLHAIDADVMPLVVFVTAHDEHALQAFDLHALDYLVKPFADSRFVAALNRAKERIHLQETASTQMRLLQLLRSRLDDVEEGALSPYMEAPCMEADPLATRSRFAVRDGARICLFTSSEVNWIEAAGSYSRIYAESGSELVRSTLGTLEKHLDPRNFFRIHRSAIVALDKLKEVKHESHGDYLVVLTDGTELRLARSRREEFEMRVGLS